MWVLGFLSMKWFKDQLLKGKYRAGLGLVSWALSRCMHGSFHAWTTIAPSSTVWSEWFRNWI
jgi:hypothetical protein